jgi:hypothetical protein
MLFLWHEDLKVRTGLLSLGMAGRYTGSYLGRPNGWRAVAILADTGQASLVGRIPKRSIMS